MKHIFRKNQVIVTALALMIAAAGYINYNNGVLTDGLLLDKTSKEPDYDMSAEALAEKDIFTDTEEASADEKSKKEAGEDETSAQGDETAGETVLTQGTVGLDKAAELKLNREQLRAANKESLSEIVNNEALTEVERTAAVEEMAKITDVSERENACELMLETKGFAGSVVSITDDRADVVINAAEITDANRAQIEDIVNRKGKISPENIVISSMNVKE